jgi:hypothetical protein
MLFFFITFVLKLNQMSELFEYLHTHRQVGQTTAMINGAANYDKPFFVLGGTFKSALEISKQSQNKNAIPISIEENSLQKLRGNDFPILIDGYAVTSEIEKIYRIHDRTVKLMYAEHESQIQSIKDSHKYIESFNLSKITSLNRFLNRAEQELKLSKEKVEQLDIRVNKTRNRLKPTLEGLSKLSMWDRVFNYKSKVKNIVEDYLY